MNPEPKKSPKRGDDQDRITFNLPKSLKEQIANAAKNDKRTVSPWLVIQLEKIMAELNPSTLSAKPPQGDRLRKSDSIGQSFRGAVKQPIRHSRRS